MAKYDNGSGLYSPLTKKNFLVKVDGVNGVATFHEARGLEVVRDAIELRQDKAFSVVPVIPGLVKYGNVTLKKGYNINIEFYQWMHECSCANREEMPRKNVSIELIDINEGTLSTAAESSTGDMEKIWVLKNAWVTEYTAPDFSATADEVVLESIELVYEELMIPN